MSHWKIVTGKDDEFYFLTDTVVNWTYLFTSYPYFELIAESLRFCQKEKELRIAAYVIMPNHLHLICSGTSRHQLSDTLRDFKQFTAKGIIKQLRDDHRDTVLQTFKTTSTVHSRNSEYKIWVDGNHPILLDTGEKFLQKLNYLHDNPVRKGYVDKPEYWQYSSARNYILGDHSILKVDILI